VLSKAMKRRILEYIAEYSSANNVTPSYREIGAAVGVKSLSTLSRYILQLKGDGLLSTSNQRSRAIALARKIELDGAGSDPQRIRLEVADGGVILFDCNLEKKRSNAVSVTFSGILDASQIKGRVGQVVNCRIEDS